MKNKDVKGKLIVIEGCDGSGKATQTLKLFERLKREGNRVRAVEFPNYKSNSSALIKMYLNGDFGSKAEEVNPYAASTFYAVDRYATFKTEWKEFYDEGGIIIADRYTTANMVHQASKIEEEKEKQEYLDWLWDFEFNKIGLPIPDCVIFLDVPPEYSRKLMKERLNKFTGEETKDIHEKDFSYLKNAYLNSCDIAEKYNWIRIKCLDKEDIRTIEEIHEEIFSSIKKIL